MAGPGNRPGREFVEQKPGKLEAVSQGGKNLSGGQKQRLTIAWTLVRRPEILILDDSASALDFATDAKLRKAIREMPGAPTVFLVSQRASSLQYADQIIVLDDGEAVGIGTHSELLESCEVYREIYESTIPEGWEEGRRMKGKEVQKGTLKKVLRRIRSYWMFWRSPCCWPRLLWRPRFISPF